VDILESKEHRNFGGQEKGEKEKKSRSHANNNMVDIQSHKIQISFEVLRVQSSVLQISKQKYFL
jgi:hypothetical protein